MSSMNANVLRAPISSPLQRRSRRVLVRIPVHLAIDNEPPVPALTADISREGGLVLSPIALRPNKVFWIQNQHNQRWARVRVVRVHSPGLLRYYEVGIEFLAEEASCWREEYEDLLTPSYSRKKTKLTAEPPAEAAPPTGFNTAASSRARSEAVRHG